jgi:hypothetical protein
MSKSSTFADRGRERAPHDRAGQEALIVGFFMVVLAAVLAYLLLKVWPASEVRTAQKVVWVNLTEDTALAIAMIGGALGSFVHIATSFASYVGNRRLAPSWIWWFLLRPPLGAALALIAYFIMRSGFLLDGALGVQVSPFGIAALGGVVGLASKQIVDKFRTVADETFHTELDEQRTDKL